jgi:DNA polymerase III epsilon subunit-like protein
MNTVPKIKSPKFGICVDWETSGSSWDGKSAEKYQGVSYGLVVFTVEDFKPIKSLYREIKFEPTKYEWTKEAENVHGLSIEHLAANGITQEEAAIDFVTLLMEYFDPNKGILFLGHNRQFDIDFTTQLLDPFGLMFNIHKVLLDTSGVGLVAVGQFKSNALFEEMGFDKRGAHNALDDALMTLLVCQKVKEYVEIGRLYLEELQNGG